MKLRKQFCSLGCYHFSAAATFIAVFILWHTIHRFNTSGTEVHHRTQPLASSFHIFTTHFFTYFRSAPPPPWPSMRLLPEVFPCQSSVCSSQLIILSYMSRLPYLPTRHTMYCINHNVRCHVTSLIHYTSPFPDKSIFCSTSTWCSKQRTILYRREKVLNNRTAGLYCTHCGNESKFLVVLLKITTMLLNLKCSKWLLLLLKPHGSLKCYNTNNKIKTVIFQNKGMRWRSLLKNCATSWKVTGLIPDGFMVIFHLLEPSGHTVVLESTQHRTEMNNRDTCCEVKAASEQGWQPCHLLVLIV
jgi:hypothetical protein